MKNYLLALMLLQGLAHADYFAVESGGDEYHGPTTDEVELVAVSETTPYGSDNPFAATVTNGSEFYLDRVAVLCDVTDLRGHRVFKGIQFKSGPAFSVRISFPWIRTPEKGIPPGATTDIGLYSDDIRWFRGHGNYRYSCRINGVSGRS